MYFHIPTDRQEPFFMISGEKDPTSIYRPGPLTTILMGSALRSHPKILSQIASTEFSFTTTVKAKVTVMSFMPTQVI
jgi:hypothetical protein